MKTCTVCKIEKPLSEFYKHATNKNGVRANCKKCFLAYERIRNKTWYQERRKVISDEGRWKLRDDAVRAYGGKCSCCGEDTEEFLQIDHTNRDGKQHRIELGGRPITKWLKDNRYPKDRFRLLCSNCNHSNGIRGYCPHQRQEVNKWIGGC